MIDVINKIPIRRNSQVHLALMYLKMKNCFVSPAELRELAPKRFSDNARARQNFSRLVQLGFAFQEDDRYAITPEGITALSLIVSQQKFKIND